MAIKKNTQTPATASAAATAPVTENNASAKKAKVVKKTVASTTAPATASAAAPAPKKETVAAPVDAAVSAAATFPLRVCAVHDNPACCSAWGQQLGDVAAA